MEKEDCDHIEAPYNPRRRWPKQREAAARGYIIAAYMFHDHPNAKRLTLTHGWIARHDYRYGNVTQGQYADLYYRSLGEDDSWIVPRVDEPASSAEDIDCAPR